MHDFYAPEREERQQDALAARATREEQTARWCDKASSGTTEAEEDLIDDRAVRDLEAAEDEELDALWDDEVDDV